MTGALRQFTARKPAAGGFSPLDIDWYAAFWAEDPDWTNPGDGNPVSSWRNAGSGDWGNAVQATVAYQPTFFASQVSFNNKPIVHGDLSDDFLLTDSGTKAFQPNTYVLIAAATGPGQHYMDGESTARRHTVYSWQNVNWYSGINRSPAVDLGIDSTTPHLVIADFNTTSSVLEVDGTQIDAGDVGNDELQGVTLFAYRPPVAGGYGGNIAFAAIYNGLLPAQDKADLLAWSQSHYGTP